MGKSIAPLLFLISIYCGIFVKIYFSFSKNFNSIFSLWWLNAFLANFIYEKSEIFFSLFSKNSSNCSSFSGSYSSSYIFIQDVEYFK